MGHLNAGILAVLALGLFGTAHAHLILKSPVPFGLDSLNNSPLVDTAIGSSTSDFPCKQRAGVYDISQMNNMSVGAPQTLSFTGSASHGGGTCQLAVSLDLEPTATSTWKIIQVYEGGCPITASGNAGTDIFTYSIPDKFPNGRSTLAWTWYNRIGNREIYMNCAPITVAGGSDDHDYYNTLPDMYIINLPSGQCSTVENTNQLVPNPGEFVLSGDPADKVASATGPACDAAAAAQTSGVSGYQSAVVSNSAAVVTGAAAASSSAAVASGDSSGGPSSYNNGQYSQATSSAAAQTSQAAMPAPSPSGMTTLASAPAYPSTSPAGGEGVSSPVGGAADGTAPTGSGASAPSPSGTGTCTDDGAVVCNGPDLFGLCNYGQVVWQAVAMGTTCSNGSVQRRDVSRHMAHARRRVPNIHHPHDASVHEGAQGLREESLEA